MDPAVPDSGTRGNRQDLRDRKLCLKKFFTVWETQHRNRLPRDAVGSPLLEILQKCLDAILCNVLYDDLA